MARRSHFRYFVRADGRTHSGRWLRWDPRSGQVCLVSATGRIHQGGYVYIRTGPLSIWGSPDRIVEEIRAGSFLEVPRGTAWETGLTRVEAGL